jgi:1,4-dihydroxy-2-naphthoate octaprenyltransferase
MGRDTILFILSWISGFVGIAIKIKPIFDFIFVFLGCVGMIVTILHTVKKLRDNS